MSAHFQNFTRLETLILSMKVVYRIFCKNMCKINMLQNFNLHFTL